MGAHNSGLHRVRGVIIRGMATELVTAKMEEEAALDAVTTPRLLMVNIFVDKTGWMMANRWHRTNRGVLYFTCREIKEYHKTFL